MFTNKDKNEPSLELQPKGRGRPKGRTEQGEEARERLYEVAIRLFTQHGYEAATLREIAREACVSPALLYRYFPSKRAVVLELYSRTTSEYVKQASKMTGKTWPSRFLFALRTSLEVLSPHRNILSALIPILVGKEDESLFSPATEFSRKRVQSVFSESVRGANSSLSEDSESLGRILYFVHLAVIFWWLLDRSKNQVATEKLLVLLEKALKSVSLALRLPGSGKVLRTLDHLILEGVLGA